MKKEIIEIVDQLINKIGKEKFLEKLETNWRFKINWKNIYLSKYKEEILSSLNLESLKENEEKFEEEYERIMKSWSREEKMKMIEKQWGIEFERD